VWITNDVLGHASKPPDNLGYQSGHRPVLMM
jgi:hypothetical protein